MSKSPLLKSNEGSGLFFCVCVLCKGHCSGLYYYKAICRFPCLPSYSSLSLINEMKVYHSALNHILVVKGMDLCTSMELSMLLRNFEKSRPPWRSGIYVGISFWFCKTLQRHLTLDKELTLKTC